MYKIVLASQSPRRKELLGRLVDGFECKPANIEEVVDLSLTPQEVVVSLALQKAEHIAKQCNGLNNIVIGADTVVVLDNKILGKPKDKPEAREMILQLQGKEHKVLTGVVMINTATNKVLKHCEQTDVMFSNMALDVIETYVNTNEPYDKAGGYGIQGLAGKYIKGINGCYYNVMGFPLNACYNLLQEITK